MPKLNAVIRFITYSEALMFQELRICEKRLFLRGGKDAKTTLALFPAVFYTLSEKIVRVAVPFEGAGDPQTVDINISVGVDRHPRVLRGDILDEAFSALRALQKDQPLVEALREPRFLRRHLYVVVVRYRAADVLALKIVLRYSDIVQIGRAHV